MNHRDKELAPEEMTVIYDGDCFACRTLADFIRQKEPESVLFKSKELFLEEFPCYARIFPDLKPELVVKTSEGEFLSGTSAWEFLINNFQSLSSLNWLARKAGLSKLPARVLKSAGHGVRALCFRCRKRKNH